MIHRLRTSGCGWSLLDGKGEGEICCLRHNPQAKVPDSWFSREKYDPLSEESPFDVNISSPIFDGVL